MELESENEKENGFEHENVLTEGTRRNRSSSESPDGEEKPWPGSPERRQNRRPGDSQHSQPPYSGITRLLSEPKL